MTKERGEGTRRGDWIEMGKRDERRHSTKVKDERRERKKLIER